MPIYEYECNECHQTFDFICNIEDRNNQKCPSCGGKATKLMANLMVTGTRDNFGIKKEFIDDQNGETIDNWKSWEKAGFRNPVEMHKGAKMKEKIQEKIKKVKNS